MKYGTKPVDLGLINIECEEMMFYQYLPIKLNNSYTVSLESRLEIILPLINKAEQDYIKTFGYTDYIDSFIYLTVKHMYQVEGQSYNRKGYHTDGFLTDDINYIWSNNNSTIFNTSKFNLSLDDTLSLKEMEEQALVENELTYPDNTLLRLDQYRVHRVAEVKELSLRTFIKVSFSKDKYDLKGNSINRLLDYDWSLRNREVSRNIPQKLKK